MSNELDTRLPDDTCKLDTDNQLVMMNLMMGLLNNDNAQIKEALDMSIKINGVSDDLLNAYAKFGIIPMVVGGVE